jgi:hypothetical protein
MWWRSATGESRPTESSSRPAKVPPALWLYRGRDCFLLPPEAHWPHSLTTTLRGSRVPAESSGGLPAGRYFYFCLPGVVTARVEVQRNGRPVEQRFDLVFDFGVGHEDATKVAGDTTSLATPEANRHCSAQSCHRQASRSRLVLGNRAIGGSGPVHWCTLQSRDCSWPLTSPRLCARRGGGSKYCYAYDVPAPPVTKISLLDFARWLAKCLDILCLHKRFPLFSGALDCRT